MKYLYSLHFIGEETEAKLSSSYMRGGLRPVTYERSMADLTSGKLPEPKPPGCLRRKSHRRTVSQSDLLTTQTTELRNKLTNCSQRREKISPINFML